MADGSDDFADAPAASLSTVTDAFSNVGYTVETGEPSPATDPLSEWLGATWAFQRSAWWSFTPSVSQDVQAHAQRSAYSPPTYDPDVLVSVFTGADVASLTLVARGSLQDGGGLDPLGNTADYTPWVANWHATAGTTYYVQVSSIYDEDIDYRLTLVPTPTDFTGDWLDGDPVEIVLDDDHAEIGVQSQASDVSGAWAGGTILDDVPAGDLFIATAPTFTPDAHYTVGWHRMDAIWPAAPTYTGSVPVDEPAEPAHASIEWAATPQEPGSDWHLAVSVQAAIGEWRPPDPAPDRDDEVDTLTTVKLAAYDVPGDPGTVYNPGFVAPATVAALETVGTGHQPDVIDFSIPTGTQNVVLAVIDTYSLTDTPPALGAGDIFESGVSISPFPTFLATAVPQYRYTFIDTIITGAVPGGSPPLRRIPPVDNGGFGPTRHHPRAVNRRAGWSY